MYDELFMFSKGAPPKMNLVTAIPNHILSICRKLFKETIPMAFQKTLPEKYIQATQKKKGNRRKTHKKKLNKQNNKNNKNKRNNKYIKKNKLNKRGKGNKNDWL